MKTQISLLTAIFSLSIFMFLFSSCEKDEGIHLTDPNKIHDVSRDTPKEVRTINDFQSYDDINEAADESLYLGEVLEKIDIENYHGLEVGIYSNPCIRGGQTLEVFNAGISAANFYDKRRFEIQWFKNQKLIKGVDKFDCVCQGNYAVIVTNKVTKQGVGIAYYTVKNECPGNKVAKVNTK